MLFVLSVLIVSTFAEFCDVPSTCHNNMVGHTGQDSWCKSTKIFRDNFCFPNVSPWCSKERQPPPPSDPLTVGTNGIYFSRTYKDGVTIDPCTPFGDIPYSENIKSVYIVHGFAATLDSSTWMEEIKTKLLELDDFNVYVIGWEPTFYNYLRAVSNTRVVARQLLRLILYNKQYQGLKMENVILIGHSLGAQIMGYVGQNWNAMKKATESKIGHIIGLDPAGPCFKRYESMLIRLSSDDAEFVQAIHTNSGTFGIMEPSGHVDFYINGGSHQPACKNVQLAVELLFDVRIVWPSPLEYQSLVCDHCIAYSYLLYSLIDKCDLWGCRCDGAAVCVPMGLNAPNYPHRGKFNVTTPTMVPFCNSIQNQCKHDNETDVNKLIRNLYSQKQYNSKIRYLDYLFGRQQQNKRNGNWPVDQTEEIKIRNMDHIFGKPPTHRGGDEPVIPLSVYNDPYTLRLSAANQSIKFQRLNLAQILGPDGWLNELLPKFCLF